MVEHKTTKWAYFAIGSVTALGLILIFSFSFFSSVAHAAGGGTFAWTSPTEIKATQMDSTVNGGSKVDVTFTCHKTITASQYVCQDLSKKTGICPTDITITGDGGSGKLDYYAPKSACDPGSIGEFTISIDNKSAAPTDVGGTGAVPAPVTTDASGTVIDPNANAGATGADPQLECHIISLNPLNYFLCPLVKGLNATINGLDHAINDMLTIDQKKIFDISCADSCNTARAYYEAWKTFRIFALSILFAGGLFMIISQALGFSFLDAYTIKKIVPRLLVAIIGIALSWQIMGFFVTLTNDLGYGVRQIIYYPFRNFPGSLQLGGGTELLLGILGLGAIGAFTIVGLLSFVATAAMAVAVAFLVLVIRQLVVVVLILFAPIAIACYVLPNTQSVWKLWYESFTKAMLMFPIIVAFLAVGRIFAVTAIGGSIANSSAASQLLGFVAYVAPYFLIPLTFKFAGGALATLGGSMNNRSKGAFAGLKKFRGNRIASMHQQRMQGKTWLGSGKTGSLYRRGALLSTANSGALTPTKRGRARFVAAEQNLMNKVANESLKNDDGRAAGDDIATSLAKEKGMNSKKFLQAYAAKALSTGQANNASEANNQAYSALSTMESSFGTRIGTSAMQVAAYKAGATSVTRYDDTDRGTKELMEDSGAMVRQGLITSTDAMATIKQNKARPEKSGISFGTGVKMINKAAAGSGSSINNDDVDEIMGTVLAGLTPGSLIGARKESMTLIASHLMKDLNKTVSTAGGDINDVRVTRKIASIAGIQDTINSQAPQMAEVFATNVMQQPIGTSGVFVRDRSDFLRADQDDDFNNIRKEWLTGSRGVVPPGTPPGFIPPPPKAP